MSRRLNYLYVLIGINVVLFTISLLFSFIAGSGGINPDPSIVAYLGALNTNAVIYQGEVWRFVTALFLHAGLLHIVLNMWALWQIGGIVERYYGDKVLLVIYVLGGIGGGLLSCLTLGSSFSVAASGAVFALIGLLLSGILARRRFGPQLPLSINDILPTILLTLAVGLNPMLRIDNMAHIGGLVSGFLLGLLIQPYQVSMRKNITIVNVGFVSSLVFIIISIMLMFISFINSLMTL
jgi:membrane associated rhomboid family serine protease